MAIDLILWASTKADFANFARSHPPANPLQTQDADGNWNDRKGFTWVWWASSGKLMTAKGTYDAEGNELTPPTLLPGFVALVRIHGAFFDGTRLEPAPDDPEASEQWARSAVAQYIKNNGTPGTMGSIPYYQIDGVRMFRPADVTAFLAANDLPGHEWLGGNAF